MTKRVQDNVWTKDLAIILMEHASVVVRMDLLEICVMIVSQFIPLIKNIEVILMKYVAYQYIYM